MFLTRQRKCSLMKPSPDKYDKYNCALDLYSSAGSSRIYIVKTSESIDTVSNLEVLSRNYTGYSTQEIPLGWRIIQDGKGYRVDQCIPCRTGYYLYLTLLDGDWNE